MTKIRSIEAKDRDAVRNLIDGTAVFK
ncbi:MAG: hypothetical protein HW408_1049, partial [Actinobacteria bacterium]|nr:hypothetical protein [Actinomycetota bacterium]